MKLTLNIFSLNFVNETVVHFLQDVRIACYLELCISYGLVVRLSVRPSVCPSVTRWH